MKRKEIIAGNEISELVTLTLNGYDQKILIEGKKKNLPIVISLHGGPGSPIPFSVGCRGMFKEFTDKYIMVYWDQLGCGINNYVIDDSFCIDSFVKMAEELIMALKKRFPDNEMMIFAISWGSILSAKLLEKNPYIVDGVIVVGQIVKNVFVCDEVKKCLNNTKIPKKKLERINELTVENCTNKDLQLISTSLRKYTNAYQNKIGAKVPMGSFIKGLLTSPDYSFKDFMAVVINGYMKNKTLWNEILRLDLTDTLNGVKIPYIILQGDTDIVASTKTIEELLVTNSNGFLELRVINNTGHLPGMEMMNELLVAIHDMGKLI